MIPDAEATCRTIALVGQLEAYDIKERAIHRYVMAQDVLPVDLPWRYPFDRELNKAEYRGLQINVHPLGRSTIYRWTIRDAGSKDPFTDSCWVVGRCDTPEEAMAAAEKTVGVLLREGGE
jgi:hypothetical protein